MSPSSAEGSTGNREQAVKKSGKRVNPADASATALKSVEYSADSVPSPSAKKENAA